MFDNQSDSTYGFFFRHTLIILNINIEVAMDSSPKPHFFPIAVGFYYLIISKYQI
jgi:hypothetical protein